MFNHLLIELYFIILTPLYLQEDRFTSDDLPLAQLASSGADGLVKIWSLIRNDISLSTSQEDNIMNAEWSTIPRELDGHDGKCVRDVAWAPSIGLASSTIASCAADRVVIWKQDVENPKVVYFNSTVSPLLRTTSLSY